MVVDVDEPDSTVNSAQVQPSANCVVGILFFDKTENNANTMLSGTRKS